MAILISYLIKLKMFPECNCHMLGTSSTLLHEKNNAFKYTMVFGYTMCFSHSLLSNLYGIWTGILLLKCQKKQATLLNQDNNSLLLHCSYALMNVDTEMHVEEKGFLRVTYYIFFLSVRDSLDKCNIKINVFKVSVKCDEVLPLR